MTQFGRSLTPIIFYTLTGLSHPSYSNKTKRKNKKGLDIRKRTTLFDSSLRLIIYYIMTDFSHQSYSTNSYLPNKKGE